MTHPQPTISFQLTTQTLIFNHHHLSHQHHAITRINAPYTKSTHHNITNHPPHQHHPSHRTTTPPNSSSRHSTPQVSQHEHPAPHLNTTRTSLHTTLQHCHRHHHPLPNRETFSQLHSPPINKTPTPHPMPTPHQYHPENHSTQTPVHHSPLTR